MERIYEGKAKIISKTEAGTLIHYFKDSATAFNAQKKAEFVGKGALNAQMTDAIFGYLRGQGIKTHLLRRVDERSLETLDLKMLPVEVVVRNRMAGSLAKRLQEPEGRVFNPPLVEWYLKDDAKGDPQVSADLLTTYYGLAVSDLEVCRITSLQVNRLLEPLFMKMGFILADFKLEFGKTSSGEIILADEFSPDNSRLWDAQTLEKFDKDRFRFDLGDLLAGYREVYRRLQAALA